MRTRSVWAAWVFVVAAMAAAWAGPGTITYQGSLTRSDGTPVSGVYPMWFWLFDAPTGTGVRWNEKVTTVTVTNGLFSVTLGEVTPFGTVFSTYPNLWLRVGVDLNGDGTFAANELYAPRQKLAGSAWAVDADTLDGKHASIFVTGVGAGTGLIRTGVATSPTLSANTTYLQRRVTGAAPAGQFIRLINADGSVVVAADQTGSDWHLTGNTGTTPGTHFAGTTDNKPFELRTNGARTLLLDPTTTSPNILAGHATNSIAAGVYGGTISGGGDSSNANRVTERFATVGGGLGNRAGNDNADLIDREYATVGGGAYNVASGVSATVGGGYLNTAAVRDSTVAGGVDNTAAEAWSTIGGGAGNRAYGVSSVVSGGVDNVTSNTDATIGGGYLNRALGFRSTIAGGSANATSDSWATVSGGEDNTAGGVSSTVSGGFSNTASGGDSTVGGGYSNVASGDYGTVPGGDRNMADGAYSFAAGRRAQANHDGTFVWADSTDADFASSGTNQFNVRATGGMHVKPGSTGMVVYADTDIAVSANKMVVDLDNANNPQIRPTQYGFVTVRPLVAASPENVYIPIDLPSKVFGVAQKIKSVQISYMVANAASYISQVDVRHALTNGSYTNLISDGTDRTSTAWETFTLTDSTPNAIDGPVFIRFYLTYTGTGATHDIYIGRIVLTLTEE